jgi:lipopolysaccharide/colanic/teichoic acid biosynthesis glycosyltransferase
LSYDRSFKKQPASANGNGAGRSGPVEIPARDGFSHSTILPEAIFLKMLCLERKRTERSRRPFILMLLDAAGLLKGGHREDALGKVIGALSRSTRETDITGWYRDSAVIGVVFTEIGVNPDGKLVTNALLGKVQNALSGALSIEQIDQVSLSFHVFPEDWDDSGPGGPADEVLYPDLSQQNGHKRAARAIKRAIDLTGSLMALVCLSPVMALIAVVIKLTSKGPVLFCQERIGHNGARFQFLKFRSMYVASDSRLHADFVKDFIAGASGSTSQKSSRQNMAYKITVDPRVTPVGRFLRRTSLDELPQFFNVLTGDMSLVGPRPCIPYEVKHYDIWHKDRFVTATPGITGLWQIRGRSKVTFDDMVRMDLEYARSWSLWLDLKILWHTPRAVVSTDGAY